MKWMRKSRCACLLALALALAPAGAGCGSEAAGAVTWERLPAPLDRAEVQGLSYAAIEGALYAATNGRGVWCYDGSSSRLLPGPLDEVMVFSVAAKDTGTDLYAAAGDLGVWRYVRGEWSDTGLPQAAYVLLLDEGAGMLYAGTNRAVWVFDGDAWKRLEGLPEVRVYALAGGTGGTIYAGTDHGVWEYTGGSWDRVGAALAGEEVLSLAFNQARGVLYAGTRESGVWGFTGEAWRLFEKGPLENPAWSMDYDEGLGLLLVGTNYGVWTYDGSLWVETGGEVGEHAILAVAVAVDAAAASAYVGTFEDVGVWRGDLGGILDSR